MEMPTGRETWIAVALAQLATTGIAGVRVEVLAKQLGVTKGGFYWHFKDRTDLLDAMTEAWSRGRIAAIEKQAELGDATPADRLRSLVKLYSERVNPEGMAVELAIRQWARSDAAAARSVATVDAARLANVAKLFGRLGLATAEADARAFLFYSFIFGQSLLFRQQSAARQRAMIASCIQTLIGVETV